MPEVLEQLTLTFDELFQAISLLENHEFVNDEEYFQTEHIQIETENGYDDIRGLIKKTAPLLAITLDTGSVIKCADKHILFDLTGARKAIEFQIGDLVKTTCGFSTITSIEKIAESADVYDIEVNNDSHTYVTNNGVVHHNTSITAALSHVYGAKGYRVITIVPSGDLVDQTAEWYDLLGMDVGVYSGQTKDIDHTHVVATWQALQYNPSVLDGFNALIWDECFSGETPVLMADLSYKNIEDVFVGDYVMSMDPDGNFVPREVLKTHVNLPKSSGKMLRLTFDNGHYVDVTEEHIFYLKDGRKVAARDLTGDDDICEFHINRMKTHWDKANQTDLNF